MLEYLIRWLQGQSRNWQSTHARCCGCPNHLTGVFARFSRENRSEEPLALQPYLRPWCNWIKGSQPAHHRPLVYWCNLWHPIIYQGTSALRVSANIPVSQLGKCCLHSHCRVTDRQWSIRVNLNSLWGLPLWVCGRSFHIRSSWNLR